MLTLAIEMTNPPPPDVRAPGGGVAVGRAEADAVEVLAVERCGRAIRGGDALLPAIDRCMRRAGCAPSSLERVAVSTGPGGYTSVRMAVTIAKTICACTGAECCAVPTAEVVRAALDERVRRGAVVVALAWKRNDVWRARFAPGGDVPERTGLVALAELAREAEDGVLVADDRLRARLALPETLRCLPPAFEPEAVLRLARRATPIDPAALVPIYPREPEAVTKWRAHHTT